MSTANEYIHLERSEYDRLTSGLVPRTGLPDRPSGLWIVPIPGATDYLAFPIYWPNETSPMCRHGMQCKFESVWMFGDGALLRCACGADEGGSDYAATTAPLATLPSSAST